MSQRVKGVFMNKRFFGMLSLIAGLMLFVSLLACKQETIEEQLPDVDNPVLVSINLPQRSGTYKSVLDDLIAETINYRLIVEKDGVVVHNQVYPASQQGITLRLSVGIHRFTLQALNSANEVLGEGSATRDLVKGTNSIDITLIPTNAYIEINVGWGGLENLGDFRLVSAGSFHTIAIKKDGTLWAWGNNDGGQLGNGTNTASNIPIQIGTARDWASVAGGNHTIALKTNGTLWARGQNLYGQLGNGTNAASNIPIQIGTASDWTSVFAGGYHHTVAIKTDGTLWAWGYNFYGQLGNGTNGNVANNELGDYDAANSNIPIQIGTANDWASISAGGYHTIALKTNGTLWAWGYNFYGQLGNGMNTDSDIPIQIGTASDWASISAGGAHTTALKTNGTLWVWGENNYGQLGLGDTNNRNVPVQLIP